jgi:LPXTG-site transpeptidase (sortase) family protein
VILRSLAAALVALAVVTPPTVTAGSGERAVPRDFPPPPIPLEGGGRSRLADAVVELDPATFDASPHRDRPAPRSLGIRTLDVDAAPVLAVGVDERGELAVPGPAQVGWYRYGPAPGEPGATVLAAHVAYDGVDGVFRHLADLDVGDEVVVSTDEGALRSYRVSSVGEHPKEALPAEVWARTGPSRLVLITCGGSFDAERRSYERNVVVWAVPA